MTVDITKIDLAAQRIAPTAVVTPLIENRALNERLGIRVLVKLETLQHTGSFKFRGAFNRLVQLTPEERRAGVVAFSSGNHGQGVALSAKLLGIPSTVVMPTDAPAIKVAATRAYGAQIHLYNRLTENREAIAAQIATAQSATLVPAFDDPDIIAGQGVAGLEMVDQAKAQGVHLDVVCVPVSGGGLLAGLCLAIEARSPGTAVWGVEPAGFEDLRLSLLARRRTVVRTTRRSLCDSLESPAPGHLTFPILQDRLAGAVAVTDAEVVEAIRFSFEALKVVVEPGGSVGLAALLAGKVKTPNAGVAGIVLSGGNVDAELFARLLAKDTVRPWSPTARGEAPDDLPPGHGD